MQEGTAWISWLIPNQMQRCTNTRDVTGLFCLRMNSNPTHLISCKQTRKGGSFSIAAQQSQGLRCRREDCSYLQTPVRPRVIPCTAANTVQSCNNYRNPPGGTVGQSCDHTLIIANPIGMKTSFAFLSFLQDQFSSNSLTAQDLSHAKRASKQQKGQ